MAMRAPCSRRILAYSQYGFFRTPLPCRASRPERLCITRRTSTAGSEGLSQDDPGFPVDILLREKRGSVQAGTYLIRDENGTVQYVGYARDIRAAVKGHRSSVGSAVCHSVERRFLPATVVANRQQLQAQQDLWLRDLGFKPPGNAELATVWQAGQLPDLGELLARQHQQLIPLLKHGCLEPNSASRPSSGGAHEFSRSGDVASIATGAAHSPGMTPREVDEALDEVRPYLQADGGDVEVASVEDGEIYLRFQGACGSCSSSSATMTDQIERALKRAFGARMKGVHQVEQATAEVTVELLDGHLDQLRPAIKNFGGFVEVIDVQSDRCLLGYTGPAQIRNGIEAAIKDKFPAIKQIAFGVL